ncbi:hypothetical protein [Flavobacterium sp. AG291]|uniref:hypothetical protein n=1 Tax=Flavobacterium sp. AG291 TaxID=2184000 RepID=UPI000E0C2A86|nr:hypothetical protein [Flavobacterium sp. AG291]RDI10468.1 hypothetical protein DEU42_107127 [Flavobacterium sp. AG291]
MENSKLYYMWVNLPNKIRLPLYTRAKERRQQICDIILKALESGEAKLIKAGLNGPNKAEASGKQNQFTNVILKYHTNGKIDFKWNEQKLIKKFADLFKTSEVIIIGDNTRLLMDTDKYRKITLEGREKWLIPNQVSST